MTKMSLYICIVVLISCNNKFAGLTYKGENQYQKISIRFFNDSVCEINQKNICPKLDTPFQTINVYAHYKIGKIKLSGYKTKGRITSKKLSKFKFKTIILTNKIISNINTNDSNLKKNCLGKPDFLLTKLIQSGRLNNFLDNTLLVKKNKLYIGFVTATKVRF